MNDIPFYPNRKDNLHCFEACLKSALKYFFLKEDYSWQKIDKITQKKRDKLSWPMAGLNYLANKQIEILLIDSFPYHKLAKEGIKFLKSIWPEEKMRQESIKELKLAIQSAQEMIEKPNIKIKVRESSIEELIRLLTLYEIIIVDINSKTIYGKKGFSPHSVIVKDITEGKVVFNDPGLPPKRNVKVDCKVFEKAWQEAGKSAIALRKKHPPTCG